MLEGQVEVVKEDTSVRVLDQPGTCFGEMSLMDDEPRSATIRTTRPTRLLEIFRDDFYPVMAAEFTIARGVLRELSARVRRDLHERLSSIREEVAHQESMRLAAELQRGLLPQAEIERSELATAGYCCPADQVGGDFYDYLDLGPERIALFIGDIMGHGVHSAMLGAVTKGGLHTQARIDPVVPAVMEAVSRLLDQGLGSWLYLTCCYLVVDFDRQMLSYANAGHPPPLMRRADGQVYELLPEYMPLGFGLTEETFVAVELPFGPDDLLVLYSDGIVGAENQDGEPYGLDRLKARLERGSPEQVRDAILADLRNYLDGRPAEDDITLVVARFHGAAVPAPGRAGSPG